MRILAVVAAAEEEEGVDHEDMVVVLEAAEVDVAAAGKSRPRCAVTCEAAAVSEGRESLFLHMLWRFEELSYLVDMGCCGLRGVRLGRTRISHFSTDVLYTVLKPVQYLYNARLHFFAPCSYNLTSPLSCPTPKFSQANTPTNLNHNHALRNLFVVLSHPSKTP